MKNKEDIKLLKEMIQELKDKNEEDIKLIKEMQTLIQEAIESISKDNQKMGVRTVR